MDFFTKPFVKTIRFPTKKKSLLKLYVKTYIQ